jgi:amino acid transporter
LIAVGQTMAVYGAIPKRFAHIHPRYKTPSFATLVMGITFNRVLRCAHSD